MIWSILEDCSMRILSSSRLLQYTHCHPDWQRTKESDMIDTCLCYFVVFPNPPGVFSHQNMIPQSHPLGVRRGSRELGVQVAGKLVAVWYQALWQNQRCVCLQVFFLFIKNCISISVFISNLANLWIIRSFLPTFHLPWARSKASKKRKNTNIATSNLFLSIGICKLTGVGSQKKGMGLGVSLFKRLRGYQLCDFNKDHCVSVGASQNDFPSVPNFQWLEGRWDGLTKSIDWIRLGFLDLLLNWWYFSWPCFHNCPSLGSRWVKLQCATLEPPGCSDVSKCRRCKKYRGNYVNVNLLREISS